MPESKQDPHQSCVTDARRLPIISIYPIHRAGEASPSLTTSARGRQMNSPAAKHLAGPRGTGNGEKAPTSKHMGWHSPVKPIHH